MLTFTCGIFFSITFIQSLHDIIVYGQTLNVGRVMTPTLALAVEREASIRAFKPEDVRQSYALILESIGIWSFDIYKVFNGDLVWFPNIYTIKNYSQLYSQCVIIPSLTENK